MTTLRLSAAAIAGTKVDAVIVGVAKSAKGKPVLVAGSQGVDAALGGRLATVVADLGLTGAANEVARFASLGAMTAASIVAVGLGDERDAYDHETVRRAVGTAVRALAGTKRVAVAMPTTPGLVAAAAEGAVLGAYAFDDFRSTSLAGRKAPVEAVTVFVPDAKDKAAVAALKRTEALAEAITLVRDLVNTPPGDLWPARLADRAVLAAEQTGLEVSVLDEKALRKGGYGGLIGVGAGSAHPPRLVRIAYRHPKATRTVALVGKGVTFDSGGLSIKPAQAMETMKMDMAGSVSVLATAMVAARLKLPVNITAWMPIAENMPSGSAIRPSDVLSIYGGKTVEVLNTDAEGRLILADAIVRAGEEAPDVIVDIATLTGACIVALGTRTSAIMSNDDDLRERIADAAAAAGELMWPMPLPADLRPTLESEVADIANMGDRNGGALVAGLFLKEFVPAGTPWAHLDIAGPAYNDGKPHGYTPTGGTGHAVRTLVTLVESYAG